MPQQPEQALDLVVHLRSVANDERRRHGPHDDSTDGSRVAYPLSAIGSALALFFNRPPYRFLIRLAGLFLGRAGFRCRSGGFRIPADGRSCGGSILSVRGTALSRSLCLCVSTTQQTTLLRGAIRRSCTMRDSVETLDDPCVMRS